MKPFQQPVPMLELELHPPLSGGTMLRLTLITTLIVVVAMIVDSRAQDDSWVEKSNENAKVLLDVMARFSPEFAGFWGVEGLDEEIMQPPLDINEQQIRAREEALATLRKRLDKETTVAIRQDLAILIEAAEKAIEGTKLEEKYDLPYFGMSEMIFRGLRTLLDDQVAEGRRPAAVVRLKKYTGVESGFEPISEQAMAFSRAHFDRGLRGPFKDDLEKDLANGPRFVAGIEQMFQQYGIPGYEEAYGKLKEQLAAYDEFLREEMLPRARSDFRQPEELYQFSLTQYGVDMPVAEMTSRAKVMFRELQNEMQAIAELVAAEHGFASSDYRDVIRELKKDQVVGEDILPLYKETIAKLEDLIEKHEVVTVPKREMRIRLASEAESAASPAPHMRPPRLIGNTGEMGEFVLPLRIPGEDGEEELQYDDFTFKAAAWTLSVHEGRPGHELQFAAMVENGVSQARALFAFNSVNVEGWALYAEAEMKPYEPLAGQLIAGQARLLRAARAFLDPGLQLGELTREDAYRVLENDVVMSRAMAMQEVERYTFRGPGQATSYFVGYCRLMELRTDVERMLGASFDRKSYHDFILAQGLLPPKVLRTSVMEKYVEPRLADDSASN
jgi:hypothetical protein